MNAPGAIELWRHPSVHDAPVALVVHGTGSNPDFVRRTFSQASHHHGYSLASYRLRGHGPTAGTPPYDFALHLDDLEAIIEELTPRILGGISLGAHLSATWAAQAGGDTGGIEGLVLALPAWTGPPDSVAEANARQADELAAIGTAACLARLDEALAGSPVHWVWEEMRRTWLDRLDGYLRGRGVTVAVVNMDMLLEKGGLLEQLRAKGYDIDPR